MNQNAMIIKLRDFTKDDHPFGNVQGKDVFHKLMNKVDSHPSCTVFGISLDGIEATDASFPRESVVALARFYRGDKSFYLTDVADQDLIDNWSYAAEAKGQPLVIWSGNQYKVIGPEMTKGTSDMVEFVLDNGSATTASISAAFGISIPNASTRLKKLYSAGYITRSEEAAESGGKEFIYYAIKSD
ncbi:helix-turn-helix domain-containing protein [Vibrio rotiferianus]|uniref:helix-turn-helix domain-containing protein n=2 Tax=Vibrio TaxID=662 RepID=UPI003242DE55